MAEIPDDSVTRHCGSALIGALPILLWVGLELDGSKLARAIDLDDRCLATETGRCFTGERGQVESVELDVVTVRHNDGRDTVEVTLAADSTPSPGERVRLERWDGEVVSLYVPARERRYHTLDWPRRWDPYVLWVGILGALCLLPAVVAGFRALGQAARSIP